MDINGGWKGQDGKSYIIHHQLFLASIVADDGTVKTALLDSNDQIFYQDDYDTFGTVENQKITWLSDTWTFTKRNAFIFLFIFFVILEKYIQNERCLIFDF